MTAQEATLYQESIEQLDPLEPPPLDRFCDVVLEGGVIDGVVYPGFLIELARKFHFHAIAGASVGAIAASLAAACEYSRRLGSDNGFNEGLAKMPDDLAQYVDSYRTITKIRSLFQPNPQIKALFDWFVDLVGIPGDSDNSTNPKQNSNQDEMGSIGALPPSAEIFSLQWWIRQIGGLIVHFGAFKTATPNMRLKTLLVLSVPWSIHVYLLVIEMPYLVVWCWLIWIVLIFFALPLLRFFAQIRLLLRMPGFGMCSGLKPEGGEHAALVEWLHEGIQKAARLPLNQPLTFGELWRAPCGPKDGSGSPMPKSIDLCMISTCLSHGRIYEFPQKKDDPPLLFRLSELKDFFPPSVIDHLRRNSLPFNIETNEWIQSRFNQRKEGRNSSRDLDERIKNRIASLNLILSDLEPNRENQAESRDIRILPIDELPVVVTARMSMSCPVLFQSLPFLSFNLDRHAEDMKLTRLWFSDGGIGSNFPIHLFDEAIPRWPTLGLKLLDQAPRDQAPKENSKPKPILTNIPYWHSFGAEDNLLYPRDQGAFSNAELGKKISTNPRLSSFTQFLFSIYTSAKDGNDQLYLRMPDIRNRVVRVYMRNRSGNMLNLKIAPTAIRWLAYRVGVEGGRNATGAYLAELQSEKYKDHVNLWQDHRWVRMHTMINGLRQYLSGFGYAVNANELPGSVGAGTLREQIELATKKPQLKSSFLQKEEAILTQEQASQLQTILSAIENLERQVNLLDLPQAYQPQPQAVLRLKPLY